MKQLPANKKTKNTWKATLNTAALFLLVVLSSTITYGQDARNSQPFSVPLKLNPALTGANNDMAVKLNYRTQWGSVQNGYATPSFTFLYPLFVNDGKGKLNIGLQALNDKAGAYSTMDVALSIGYNLQLTETSHNLSAAILGGYVMQSLSTSDLSFDDQYVIGAYDAANPTNETVLNDNVSYPDVGFGLMYYYNPSREESMMNAYFGFSLYHLSQPNESYTNQTGTVPVRQSFLAGVKLMTEGGLDFSPNITISSQGGSEEVSMGLYVDYSLNDNAKVTLGGWYRKRSGIAAILGFSYDKYSLGYSYDIGTSELNRAVSGLMTHEITLSFNMDMAAKKDMEFNPSPFSGF